MKKAMRGLIAVLIAVGALAAAPRPAGAHPLGNFTINHYTALTVGAKVVEVRYILDLAEIPAFQELRDIRPDGSTDLTPAQRAAYLDRIEAVVRSKMTLTLDGKPLALATGGRALSFPPGAGGLPLLRLVLDFRAALPTAGGALYYSDTYQVERAGWREIIAVAGPGVEFRQSSVPNTDRSRALTAYPTDMLNSPPRVSEATVQFAPGAGAATAAGVAAPAPANDLTGWLASRTDAMTELMARKELPLDVILTGLLIAFFLGAGHALAPGHGKAVAASYLVGSRGTAGHALLLGVTVTVTHTIGVFLFGLVILFAADYILPEALYPWLSFVSGLMIVAVGLALVVQRGRPLWAAWRARTARAAHSSAHALGLPHRHADAPEGVALAVAAAPTADALLAQPRLHTHGPDHDHDHEAHDHGHAHSPNHDHEHGPGPDHAAGTHSHGPLDKPHSHLPPAGEQVTLRSLLALGISGGIIPCPSALVVLLSAMAIGRVGIGLLLIVTFSAGLAAVLTGIGLLMVYARRLMSRLPFESGLLQPLGVLSALAVTAAGLAIAVTSLTGAGILRF